MIITTAATGLAALITAGTLLFTHAPQQQQPAVVPPATQQQTEPMRQPKHYSTPGIAGKEKAQAAQPTAGTPARTQAQSTAPDERTNTIDLRGVRMLELTDDELLKLGVEHKDDAVTVYQRRNSTSISRMSVTAKGTALNPTVEQPPVFPVLHTNHLRMITDDLGNRRVEQYKTDENDETDENNGKNTTEQDPTHFVFFTPNNKDMSQSKVIEVRGTGANRTTTERLATQEEIDDFLQSEQKHQTAPHKITSQNIQAEKWIAILVKSDKPQDNTGKHWRTNYVLWYEPTPEVLAALPERYRKDIKQELLIAAGVSVNAAATAHPHEGFIGLWQTKSGAITASSVYPNPVANGAVTVSYTLSSPRTVTITLRSITGAIISQLASHSQQAGTWTEEYKTGNIRPGMYIISIETDNGEYSVQRLIAE